MKNKKGFTLVEIIVVIALLAIISTVAIVSINTNKSKKGEATYLNKLLAMSEIYIENNKGKLLWDSFAFPGDTRCISITNLIDEGLYDENIVNPFKKENYELDFLELKINEDGKSYGINYPLPKGHPCIEKSSNKSYYLVSNLTLKPEEDLESKKIYAPDSFYNNIYTSKVQESQDNYIYEYKEAHDGISLIMNSPEVLMNLYLKYITNPDLYDFAVNEYYPTFYKMLHNGYLRYYMENGMVLVDEDDNIYDILTSDDINVDYGTFVNIKEEVREKYGKQYSGSVEAFDEMKYFDKILDGRLNVNINEQKLDENYVSSVTYSVKEDSKYMTSNMIKNPSLVVPIRYVDSSDGYKYSFMNENYYSGSDKKIVFEEAGAPENLILFDAFDGPSNIKIIDFSTPKNSEFYLTSNETEKTVKSDDNEIIPYEITIKDVENYNSGEYSGLSRYKFNIKVSSLLGMKYSFDDIELLYENRCGLEDIYDDIKIQITNNIINNTFYFSSDGDGRAYYYCDNEYKRKENECRRPSYKFYKFKRNNEYTVPSYEVTSNNNICNYNLNQAEGVLIPIYYKYEYENQMYPKEVETGEFFSESEEKGNEYTLQSNETTYLQLPWGVLEDFVSCKNLELRQDYHPGTFSLYNYQYYYGPNLFVETGEPLYCFADYFLYFYYQILYESYNYNDYLKEKKLQYFPKYYSPIIGPFKIANGVEVYNDSGPIDDALDAITEIANILYYNNLYDDGIVNFTFDDLKDNYQAEFDSYQQALYTIKDYFSTSEDDSVRFGFDGVISYNNVTFNFDAYLSSDF